MTKKNNKKKPATRRTYDEALKAEAVKMMLDGHSAQSVVNNLGINSTALLYRWKAKFLEQNPPTATLDQRAQDLEEELRRAQRERDILKKALAICTQYQ